jgi:hypothetical protein
MEIRPTHFAIVFLSPACKIQAAGRPCSSAAVGLLVGTVIAGLPQGHGSSMLCKLSAITKNIMEQLVSSMISFGISVFCKPDSREIPTHRRANRRRATN